MGKIYQLSEYEVPDFFMTHVDLEIDITKNPPQSKARLTLKPNPAISIHPSNLILDGENMKLSSLLLDGKPLSTEDYSVTDKELNISTVPTDREFSLEITAILGQNTDLFGLYETEGTVLVKAETEGMRRVFYCLDRPDNAATYTTTIIADAEKYPVLLSNGEKIAETTLPNGAHSVVWEDMIPKPTYLFAMVAGKLEYSATNYQSQSGRTIPIEFFLSAGATQYCDLAKETIQRAMRWDEVVFKLPCYLKNHKIAGVDRYGSGASEPTTLNLFNTAFLFASPKTKTDASMLNVVEVVAHEYYHLWSGNRVTIRDWFNLCFKEGLTTFRAALFREELFGSDLVRLIDGKNLDDRAPRQSSYTAVRSLYTAAAYEKSADIFRMMMLVIGKERFITAMNKFLTDNAGGAVTIESVLDSLTASTEVPLTNFLPWFTEPGIPRVNVQSSYDENAKQYTLKVLVKDRKSRPIPLAIGLIDQEGNDLLGDKILLVDQDEMEFQFDNIAGKPTPSLLRSFSAPVNLFYNYTNSELLHLMRYDTNHYNRCEAANRLIEKLVQEHCAGKPVVLSPEFFATYRSLLTDPNLSQWIIAEILNLPSEEDLSTSFNKPDFAAIAEARRTILSAIAKELLPEFKALLTQLENQTEVTDPQFSILDIRDVGKRRLMKLCLSFIQVMEPEATLKELSVRFKKSLGVNMTESLDTLSLLSESDCGESQEALDLFYNYWQQDSSVLNYWLSIQASVHTSTVIEKVNQLLQHPAFDISNPNKVYALLGAFGRNPYGFHDISGNGYKLFTDTICKLDKINPAVAAKLTTNFVNWDKYDTKRQRMMFNCLILMNTQTTSVDVKNVLKIALDKSPPGTSESFSHMFKEPKTNVDPLEGNNTCITVGPV